MTDHDLEQRLRAWYRAEIDDGESAPFQLRAELEKFAQTAATPRRHLLPEWRFPAMNRFAPLAIAATAVVVAIIVGIGLLVAPPDVGPSLLPDPTHSATPQPTASPQATLRAAGWTATGNMLEARTRYQTATLLLDGRVLVAGGDDPASGGLISAELYDPSSGSWTATGSMTMAHAGGTATLLRNGKVLVAGGFGSLPSTSWEGARRSAELYDPVSGSWSATGSMDALFSEHTATLMADGKVLIAGGGSAALYDPTEGTWRATGQMIEQRDYHTATLLPDGRVLVAGGGAEPEDFLASAELFDPATGTWSAARDMARGRSYHHAVLLPNGTVLVTGGWVKGDPGQDLEAPAFDQQYDPATGTWTATSIMDAIRGFGATDTLLRDGTVLVTGGGLGENRLLASAELYDTSSGIWIATANMHRPRTYNTATLLLDGTVLVAGGYGNGSSALTSAELYEPGSGN
jgi:hypothetical protein